MTPSLMITLIILFIVAVILFVYLLIRHKKKSDNLKLTGEEKVVENTDQPGDWVYLIVIGIIIVLIVGFYFTFKRYNVALKGLESGHPGVAVAALSPEIGEGVADVIRGFRS